MSKEHGRRMVFARQEAAQAWCKEKTASTEMDAALAEEFAKILVVHMYAPHMGCATTGDLLDEVKARVDTEYSVLNRDAPFPPPEQAPDGHKADEPGEETGDAIFDVTTGTLAPEEVEKLIEDNLELSAYAFPMPPARHPHRCPICRGNEIPCRACQGIGIIWSPE